MISAKNVVVVSGGLTADPERPAPSIATMRIGLDFAGTEKESDNKSGYFDVKMFLNDDSNQNVRFFTSQLDKGNLKKGSAVVVVGRLVQERWKDSEGKNNSKVVIYAESIEYAGPRQTSGGDKTESGTALPSQF